MTRAPNILLISPFAPPKNTAEAIQVRRILAVLDTKATGRLVTVMPDDFGWAQGDATLDVALKNFDTQRLALPLHRFTNRILSSHRMARFHRPDHMFWIVGMANRIVADVKKKSVSGGAYDVIYSRSYPISAALLARKLKQKLNIPWILHLSDPWAENPYAGPYLNDVADESDCFQRADIIALTTEGQANHYRKKYPELAHKMIVSPNVMPDAAEAHALLTHVAPSTRDERLHIVFAGNLYGDRTPQPFIDALEILRATRPELLAKLCIDFYGRAQGDALTALTRAADVIHHHGAVSFAQAYAAQHAADIVLSIEPENNHPLARCFLPSKVLECLALGKPLIALTPPGSETESICREGYGWAISPSQPEALAACIVARIEALDALRNAPAKAPPKRYDAHAVVDDLLQHMRRISQERSP